jgi:PPP family 3-phenylpropionic acid transporter
MPAMVYYVNEIMSPGEAVKGQALFTMMLTFSTIAASFAGGWLLDAYGAGTLTFVSAIVTAVGAAVVILFVDKVKSHKEQPDESDCL